MLDFSNEMALAAFVRNMRGFGLIHEGDGVFNADALDFGRDTGVSRKNSYVLRPVEEHDGRHRLVVSTMVDV